MSETERANRSYAIDRYFLMDSQKLLSWRDPNYTAKFNHYILEEGINPITLEPATAEEVQTAEWYNRIHPITETLSWGGLPCIQLMWAITSITINLIQQSPKPSAREKIGSKGKFQVWGVRRWLVLNFHQRIWTPNYLKLMLVA